MRYSLKILLLKSGERLPILVNEFGMPVHGPTVFAVAEVRNRHRAANTIANVLAALSVLQSFLDFRNIDLAARLNAGTLLELGEIEDVVRTCRADLSHGHLNKVVVNA